MGDGFRGVSADQDGRFKTAEKKLLAKMKFPPHFSIRVEMNKVHLEVFRPWIAKKVTGYLGLEDDIVINMVLAELEKENEPDPRKIQINLTGFLERNTGAFMSELWNLLISAQENFVPGQKGMPTQLLKEKEDDIKRINQELQERAKKISDDQARHKERKEKEQDRPSESSSAWRAPPPPPHPSSGGGPAPRDRWEASRDDDGYVGRRGRWEESRGPPRPPPPQPTWDRDRRSRSRSSAFLCECC